MPFKKGQSGNLKGRSKGVKDQGYLVMVYFAEHKQKLLDKALELVLAGDSQMLICIDQI
ncbi:hypothetical protein [Candidatus Nitrosacidococcus tergens]|uniref:DUF5681 domain-containing protein n=1 Tax=Candidatus Nitrosacidococcus tergens TaxID=553981 RepID=A0A7G1QA19_9GAMM|nr:hypothetical protein [Candidatus Nitrosacidococcus tergens]CAB1275753.1 conserved protein of unknown function [Candidatus Nitrosacidococcus tergens]